MESLKTVVNRGMQKHPSEAEVSCGENLLHKTNGIAKWLVDLLWVVLLFSFDYSQDMLILGLLLDGRNKSSLYT